MEERSVIMILEKRIVIDLNDHESSWLIPFVQKAPDGYVGQTLTVDDLHQIEARFGVKAREGWLD